MYRRRRHDPAPEIREFQVASEKPDPLAAHRPEPLISQLSAALRAFLDNQNIRRCMPTPKDFSRLPSESAAADDPKYFFSSWVQRL